MKERYDVIVVGAGPAGLLAAKAAGLAGCDVALIDRKSDLSVLTRACGQSLISMNEYYCDDLLNLNKKGKRIGFLKNGFSFGYDGPVKNINAWHLYSPDGNGLYLGVAEEARKRGDDGAVCGIAIDKSILFRCLLEEVQEAGVDILPGINVTEVSTFSNTVKVSGSGKTFEGKYLIAADGANSRIAKLLGFNKDRTFYCYLLCKGYYMENVRAPEPDIIIGVATYNPEMPGMMFLVPRAQGDEHNVMFLSLDPRVNLDEVADYFMNENAFFSEWFTDAKRGEEMAYSQYIYSPIAEPYKDRVIIAGDAGACQEMENTGAMISGWKAGNSAAAAVKEERVGIEARGIPDYINWWKTAYLESHPHEVYLMNFAMQYVIDSAEDINYIFSLIKDPMPPRYNPYSALASMSERIQGIVPTIQKERPDIMPKLAKMSSPVAEILEETTKACQPLAEFDK